MTEGAINWPARLGFSDLITSPRPLDELFYAAAKAGVAGISMHIHVVEEYGFAKFAKLVRDSGVPIMNYAAVGHWVSGMDYSHRPRTLADAIRNLDESAELGCEIVGVNAGQLAADDKDLEAARERVIEGIAELIPYAEERKLKLAIEPVHPIFLGNGPVLVTLRHTMDVIERVGSPDCLGVMLDTYHLWWEPDLAAQLRRAQDRIFLVQLSDWDPAMATRNPRYRALPGEGCIDFSVFFDALQGFDGWFESDASNAERWPSVQLPEIFEVSARNFQENFGHYLR